MQRLRSISLILALLILTSGCISDTQQQTNMTEPPLPPPIPALPTEGQAVSAGSITGMTPHSTYSGFAEPETFTLPTAYTFSSTADTNTISLTINDAYVYRYAFISYDGNAWQQVNLTGTLSTHYITDSATASISITPDNFSLATPDQTATRNYIVTYTCNSTFYCHGGWQIRQFNASLEEEPVGPPQNAEIVGVSASSFQVPNAPENSLDGVLSDTSRWAADGDGQWITYELNQTATVSYVRIAFFSDSIRYFDIQHSTDNLVWTNTSASGMASQGNMENQFQTFNFTPVSARYIRLLGHGSSESSWNSIVEMDVNGFEVNLSSTPAAYCGDVYCDSPNETCGDSDVAPECNSDCGSCEEDIFNIYFSQNFEDDTVGAYDENEWKEDWNYPPWADFNSVSIEQCEDEDNPSKVMRCDFEEGDWGLYMGSGIQWYSELPDVYDELYFSYRLRLKEGFDPVLSGKFCGLYGFPDWGAGAPGEDDGFSAKFCWTHVENSIYVYYYHHEQEGEYGDAFGADPGYGLDNMETRWVTFTLRIVMNTFTGDEANDDGIAEIFADSICIAQKTDIIWRENPDVGIDRMHIESFFGGGDDSFAASRDEWIKFDDFVVFTYKNGVDVPRGNEPSPEGRVLVLP